MGTVQFKTTSDAKQLERDLDKARKDYSKLREEVEKLKEASRNAENERRKQSKDEQRDSQQALSNLQSMVASWMSVGAAINLVKQSYQEYIQLQDEDLMLKRQVAGEQAGTLLNLAGLRRDQRAAILQQAREIEFGDQGLVLRALGQTVSAGATPQEAADAVRTAAKLTLLQPQAMPTLAGAAIDLQTATGVRGAEQNLGFLLTAAAGSRIASLEQLGKNLSPAIAATLATVGQQDRVDAARETAATFGELSRRLNDTMGDVTKTAQRQLAAESRRFFAEGFGPDKDRIQPTVDPGTFFGRLEAIAKDEKLRQAFVSDAALGEGRQIIEQLLTPEGLAALRTGKAGVQFDAGLTRELIEDISTLTPQLRAGTAAERLQHVLEQFGLETTTEDESLARKTIKAIATRAGQGMLPAALEPVRTEFETRVAAGQDPITVVEQIANRRMAELTQPRGAFGVAGVPREEARGLRRFTGIFAPEPKPPELSQDEKNQVELLRAIVPILKDMRDESRQTNRALGAGGAAAQLGVGIEN